MSSLQNNLVRAVDRVMAIMEDSDTTAFDAIVKVASAQSLLPDQVDRLCQLYNRSAVLTKRLSPGLLSDKLASVDPVDPRAVQQQMTKNIKKQASAPLLPTVNKLLTASRQTVFSGQPETPKRASMTVRKPDIGPPPTSDPRAGLHHGVSGVELVELRNAITSKLAALEQDGEQLLKYAEVMTGLAITSVKKLASMSNGAERVRQVEYWVSQNKPDGAPILQEVMLNQLSKLTNEKRAAIGNEPPASWLPGVVGEQSATSYFSDMLDAVRQVQDGIPKIGAKVAALREELYLIGQKTRQGCVENYEFVMGDVSLRERQLDHIAKVANLVDAYLGSALASGGSKPANPKTLTPVDRYKLKLQHPQHEAALGQVRSRRALQEMLTDDPVISASPQEEVVAAFNELSAYSPKITQNPATLRAVLRQYLQNNASSFDLAQVKSLERNSAAS